MPEEPGEAGKPEAVDGPSLPASSKPAPQPPVPAPPVPQGPAPELPELSSPELPPGQAYPLGSIRVQEAGVTQRRPPTVAEARARDKAIRDRVAGERAEREAAAAAIARKKRRMRGAVAVVGVAAVVGAGYLIYRASETPDVTAECILDENGKQVVVDDAYCGGSDASGSSRYASSGYDGSGGYYHGGGHLVPIPIPIPLGGGGYQTAGHQYRYYYGGANTPVGSRPTGGSTIAPKNANVHTKSGSVVRGGFGSKSSGGS